MDPKNLAVLMQLKERMSSKKTDGARDGSESADTKTDRGSRYKPPLSGKCGVQGRSNRRVESTTYRGIDVGHAHYKALVEAVSSTSTANSLRKLEALAYYLEKSPNDQGALKAFDRLSQASTEARSQKPRKSPPTKLRPNPARLSTELQVRAECSKCRNVYAVGFNRVPPSWTCQSCLRLEKIAKQDEAQALTDRQYANGTGNLVRKIEAKIASLRAILESGNIENPRGLMLQISQLEKRLKLEKAHAISGFRKIRAYQVPGSYGSST